MNIRRLETAGFAVWPAREQLHIDDWVFRSSGGAARRSNCVTPIGPVQDGNLAAAIDRCEQLFSERQLRSIFRLTPLAPPELAGLLHERGYVEGRNSPTHIMTRSVAGRTADPHVGIRATASSAWLGLADPQDQKGLGHLLSYNSNPAGFAELAIDGQLVGIGLAIVAGETAGIFNVQTVLEARGQGVAQRVTVTLANYAAANGATELLVQVVAANQSAVQFWQQQDFAVQYDYAYFESPITSGF